MYLVISNFLIRERKGNRFREVSTFEDDTKAENRLSSTDLARCQSCQGTKILPWVVLLINLFRRALEYVTTFNKSVYIGLLTHHIKPSGLSFNFHFVASNWIKKFFVIGECTERKKWLQYHYLAVIHSHLRFQVYIYCCFNHAHTNSNY